MFINDTPLLNVCFNGCSLTVGEGFPEEMRKDYIYSWVLAKKFNFNLTNIAVPGSSNYNIFIRTAQAILSGNYNIIFTQWTVPNRLWLSPGPESYFFTNDEKNKDFKYRDLYISPKERTVFKNTLLLLNHDYQNILDLIDYCKILKVLAEYRSVNLIYINGTIPWERDLLTPITGKNLSVELSNYSKEILDFETRDDYEIIQYFVKLQNKFADLDLAMWVNIFESFLKNSIDTGPEGHHPGIKSHHWMAEQISTYLTTNNIL